MSIADSGGMPSCGRLRRWPTTLPVVLFGAALVGPATAQSPWNIGEQIGEAGQWTVFGRSQDAGDVGTPVASGDLNGDGLGDIVFAPMRANSGPSGGRIDAGEVTIVLGDGSASGVLDTVDLNDAALPPSVAIVYGADDRDLLGTQVMVADIDGDGFEDAILGAQYGDGAGNLRGESGEVAIVWGGESIGGRVIDLASLLPSDEVTILYGADAADRFGTWLSAGDFDGDGTADVVVGADQADGPSEDRSRAGETYVIYGGAALRAQSVVDLAAPAIAVTRIYGIDAEDHSGCTVRSFDLDADGAAEVLIGAGLNRASSALGPNGGFSEAGFDGFGGGDGPDNDRPSAGEAYVIYGQIGVRPGDIDLRMPPATMVTVYGIDVGDFYGEELFAGDFNGDGHGDLIVGAITGDGLDNGVGDAGEGALILGGPGLPGSTIDLAAVQAAAATGASPGTTGGITFFYGVGRRDIAADTAMFADVDRDGRDDLLIAAPNADAAGRTQAGRVYVLFGTDAALPAEVELDAIPPVLDSLLIDGADAGDLLAYSFFPGDMEGDGHADMLANAMHGDGEGNAIRNVADAYFLSGYRMSLAAGRVACALDSDDSGGSADIATDVVYIARRLLGFDPVPPSFRDADPSIPTDVYVASRVDVLDILLDVDGSGAVDVATDVVYIARHLLGLDPVPQSFRDSDPGIPDDATIAAAIDGLCG